MKKIIFISSTGGHLEELLKLKELFNCYDYFIVTEKMKSNLYLKVQYQKRVAYLLYGTKDKNLFLYLFIFIFNIFKSFLIFITKRPDIIITTGTHTAVPMAYIAKIFKKKLIYIETLASCEKPSKTGRILYKKADLFIVQWEELLKYFPDAKYFGSIY